MEPNPYKPDYHTYLENLKSHLDQTDSYVKSNTVPKYTYAPTDLNIPQKNTMAKYALMVTAAVIVGISLVSFLTQGALMLFGRSRPATVATQDTIDDQVKGMYVRADAAGKVFPATSTAKQQTTFDVNNYLNVNIPGVTRIGYDESLGNQYLTDNINKYSSETLVIGQRQSPGEINPGGEEGSDDPSVDKYDLAANAVIPNLNSKAYVMADLDSGEIILEKNSDTIYPIASVSKLMTAVIVTEKMNLQDVAIVSKDATNAYGSQGSLVLGEKIRLADLIYPLIMESSNDAAEVFADHYGHEAFMDEMNKKANALDMTNTYYNDPSGLDPKNSSTPNDLLKLVRYIWKKDPTIFDTTRVKQFSIKGHTWLNRNPQLPLAGYIGGKNGYIDQALQTTASLFEIPTAKGGMRKVAIIVLKSNDKNNDVLKLITFMKKYVIYTP